MSQTNHRTFLRTIILLAGAVLVVSLCCVAGGVSVWQRVLSPLASDFLTKQANSAADRLKREMDSRELLVPTNVIPGFRSDAVVTLIYLGRQELAIEMKWPRVGFVIGDGTLILTAAHCVLDLDERGHQALSPDTLIVSPYYGDVFEFKILAVDRDADLAILKAPWPAHPALVLADYSELKATKDILVTGYPHSEQGVVAEHFVKDVRMERLPVRGIDESRPNTAIQLKGARFGGPGWSGSALVLPESGKVAGALTTLTRQSIRTATNDKVLIKRDLAGCSVESITRLLQKHGLTKSAHAPAPQLPAVTDSREAFSMAMEYVEQTRHRDPSRPLALARQLVALRPDSAQARLWLAWSAYRLNTMGGERAELAELAETSFKAALRLSPDSAAAHAGFGNFLMFRSRYDEALAHIEAALAIEPGNDLALVNRLRILTKTNPQRAVDLGRELVEDHPDNPHYWFWFSDALSQVEHHEQALEAARKAVALNPDGLYRNRLADALTQLGRLDEAEEQRKTMTVDCDCQACWVKYAVFLLEQRKDKLDEARQAVETAESKEWHRVSESDLRNLRSKLEVVSLRSLAKKSPADAEALGRGLLEDSPTNGHYWFTMAGVLRTLGKHDEAVQAAQHAVRLCPDSNYQPRLAHTLARVGRLEESEKTYRQMLKAHPDRPKYWFWFARFLCDHHPERIAEARESFARAQLPHPVWAVSTNDLKELADVVDSIYEGKTRMH